LVNVVAIDAV